MGKLGEHAEAKLRKLMTDARNASVVRYRLREDDPAIRSSAEMMEWTAWNELYKFLTDDELTGIVSGEVLAKLEDEPDAQGEENK